MKTINKISIICMLSLVFSNVDFMMNYMFNKYEFGIEVGGFDTPELKDNEFTKYSGWYMYFISDLNVSGEDYSSTLGPDGYGGDQYLGEGSTLNYFGGGAYFYTPIKKDKSIFLQNSLGLFWFYENFHNQYYDSFQILGNNGYYYTEGYTSGNQSLGIDIGSSIVFGLGEKSRYKEGYSYYLSLGGSISTKGVFSFKVGLGF